MINQNQIAAACETVVGTIPTVQVSRGAIGVTVLLGDEPVITMSPVGGQVLISTRTWLKARPPASDTLRHHSSSRDEDWQMCTATRASDLYVILHRASPGLQYRALLPQRIAAKLGGVPQRLLEQSQPEYWVAMARWVDGSGLLTRNDAKFARIYARKLRRSQPASDEFKAWAMRTATAASKAGFTALVPIDEAAFEMDERIDSLEASPVPVVEPVYLADGVQEVVDLILQLDAAQVAKIAAAVGLEADPLQKARASVIRANRADDRRRAKAAVAHAIDDARRRLGPNPGLDVVQRLAADTAAALAVRAEIDAAALGLVLRQWQRVTGQHLT